MGSIKLAREQQCRFTQIAIHCPHSLTPTITALTRRVQIISKVYLKKHTSQGRTYILNKKDAKMVKDSMRNRDSP